jgi:Zn-dependent peptidase ImmA (M78 family)/DNA-binding XRE family transcriptional regulator
MDKKNVGKNVRRLRLEKGWTQAKLHEEAGLSIPAIGSIENGKAEPRFSNINKIAEALKIDVYELLKEPPRLDSVRFRANRKMKKREYILAEVADWLNNYNLLESLLHKEQTNCIRQIADKVDSNASSREKAISAASIARSIFDLADDEPINDLCSLVESNGIKVFERQLNSSDFFGLSVGEEAGGPAIIVNTNERISVERWIFTVAHELAHLILHQSAYDSSVEDEDEAEEEEANIFASHFLVPEKAFIKAWEDYYGMPLVERVLRVKRIFNVSYKTILYRVNELTGEEQNIWLLFNRRYKMQYGKSLANHHEPLGIGRNQFRVFEPESKISAEPNKLDQSEFGEGQYRSLIRRAVEAECITASKAAKMLKLSIADFNQLAACWV